MRRVAAARGRSVRVASVYFLPCLAMSLLLSRLPRWSRAPAARSSAGGRARDGLVADLDAHRAGGAGHLGHRAFEVDGVEVGHLRLGDLAHLRLGDRARLVGARVRRALLDARGLPQQERGGRRLGDERERPVLEDRDLGRDHHAALVLGRGVVRLAEVHDVDAVRAERGTDRRRRRGLRPPGSGSCTIAATLRLLVAIVWLARSLVACARRRVLQLGDLAELELDRGLAAEDVHEHLELRAVDVDLGDRAVEVGERAGDDPHLLAHLELERAAAPSSRPRASRLRRRRGCPRPPCATAAWAWRRCRRTR